MAALFLRTRRQARVRAGATASARDPGLELLFALQTAHHLLGVGVHFRAVHLHPYYAEHWGFRRGMFPRAEYYSDRTISLPLYAKMTDHDAGQVVEAVRKVVAHFSR